MLAGIAIPIVLQLRKTIASAQQFLDTSSAKADRAFSEVSQLTARIGSVLDAVESGGKRGREPFISPHNTFFALLTQQDQLRCFASVAALLEHGGRFVIEAFVPDLSRFGRAQPALLAGFDGPSVHLEASQHDLAQQRVSTRFISMSDAGVTVRPIEVRYAWPSELDLMAKLAGLEREGRWAGWSRQAFSSGSGMHVSAWRRA